MIRLVILGSTDLRAADGEPLDVLLRRPKSLALLAYLAISGRDYLRRDSVVGLFWPDSTQAHARGSLSTALTALREVLGSDVVDPRGTEEIRLRAGSVWCDVALFEEAVEQGRLEAALDAYRGDLLPGFFVKEAPEFEHWLDERRQTFRSVALRCAWSLCERAEQDDDRAAAASWVRRAIELSPDDEAGVQRGATILDRLGDRTTALAVCEDLVRRLATRDDVPTPELQDLLARLRKGEGQEPDRRAVGLAKERAERILDAGPARDPAMEHSPPVIAARAAGGPVTGRALIDSSGRRRLLRVRARTALWLAPALIVSALLVMARADRSDHARRELAGRPTLILAGFQDRSEDTRLRYLAPALTSALLAQLADTDAIDVVVLPSARRARPSGGEATDGSNVESGFLVRGEVLGSNAQIRVSVAFVDASTGKVLRTAALDRRGGDTFALADDLSVEVASFLRVQLGREVRLRQWKEGASDLYAWQLVQIAETTRDHAQRMQERGSIAAAAAGFEEADSLLHIAEARDPGWTELLLRRARLAGDVGWLAFARLRDTVRARESMEHKFRLSNDAVARDPTSVNALEERALAVYWMWLMTPAMESTAEAKLLQRVDADLRRAVAEDPARPRAWSVLSDLYFQSGRFEEAHSAALRAYDHDAYLENPHEILDRLFVTAYEIGDDRAAAQWCAELGRRSDLNWIAAYCKLRMLAWGIESARSADDAWLLVETAALDRAAGQVLRPRFEMLAAAALAREGLPDSAQAVLSRARRATATDSELLHLEAAARNLLGDTDSTAILLATYVEHRLSATAGITRSRRFVALREHPAIRRYLSVADGSL